MLQLGRTILGGLTALSMISCAPATPPAPAPAAPQTPTAPASAPEAAKPYTIELPSGWTRGPSGKEERFADPDGTVEVFLAIVEQDDLDRAIDDAATAHGITLEERSRTSSAAGLVYDGSRVATYMSDDESELAQIIAHSKGATAVVFVIRGKTKDLSRRGAEAGQLVESLKLAGQEALVLKPGDHHLLDRAARDTLFAYVESIRQVTEVPGVTMALVQGGEIDARGLGLRRADGKPVDADTQFMIGSITKSFSTLLMATLVDDGKMRWDAPVTEMWPSFRLADPEATKALRMDHFFCACTGLPRNDLELVFQYRGVNADAQFARVAKLAPTTGFNETFQYNNQLTAVGGYIAGHAHDPQQKDLSKAYEAALTKRVLEPLEMTSSTLSIAAVERRNNYAEPHRVVGTETERVDLREEEFAPSIAPAGGLWSTARDMAKYVQLQLRHGVGPKGRVVSAESLARTQTPGVKIGADSHYGLGWILSSSHGLRTISHGGGTFGFGSQLVFFPDLDVGLFISGNRIPDGNVLRAAEGRLLELLFGVDLKVRDKIETAIAERKRLFAEGVAKIADEAPPAALAGRYRNEVLGELNAEVQGRRLRIDVGEWKAFLVPVVESEGKQRLRLLGGPLDGLVMRYELTPKPVLLLSDGQHEFRFER
ncbi:MAG: serine hydrolase domain-containing protein [Polyangiaceae bacterium]